MKLAVLLLVIICPLLRAGEPAAFFEAKVRPLLEQRCYECHSHASKIKGGLVLDSKSGWQKGGDHGTAVIPGMVDDSLLIKAVRYMDHDLQMPPKKKLSAEETAILEQWVAQGAPDPRENGMLAKKKGIDFPSALKHWAFQPVPADQRGSGARLETVSGEESDRYTLLRRVSFDLTGLPPTPEQITEFVKDASPSAYERVVDRLLGSAAFGERWARHWLDLVGYADQIGTANNVPATEAWRYRDYVIRSFNADKPFDRFIHEQIAGDLMKSADIRERQDQITATGFLLLGNINIVEADKDKLRVDVVDQQIEKIGKTFLGMTLQCVRCHDHKFDPITQADYYGLAGIFMSTESVYFTGRGVWSAPTMTELSETESDRTIRERALKGHLELVSKLKAEREAAKQLSRELAAQIAKETDKPKCEPLEKQKAESDKNAASIDKRLQHLDYIQPSIAKVHATRDGAKPGDTPLTIRGNPHAPGPLMPRGFVKAAFKGDAPSIPQQESGRVQLADWLTSPQNTLTARVTVNRIWQHLFGEGIVRSVDYFGLRGEKPTDPALLDHLASRFIKLGWSQKKLIREIVMSPAYRQSTNQASPTIAQSRFRLDAEAIRDAVLAISGSLVAHNGTSALALEYPENVNGLDPKNVNPVAFSVSKFRPEQSSERTIYLPVVRSSSQKGPAEILDIFDFAQPAQMQGRRDITTVPPQALFLMNGPLLKAEAAKLAALLLKSDAADDDTRLADLYLRVLNRPITADESREATAFIATFDKPIAASDELPKRRQQAWSALCHALFTCNEFLFRL
jgi:hypothetical protein